MFGLLVTCLVMSGFCQRLSPADNPINCESIVSNNDYTEVHAKADCERIDYCYWDDNTCKKDDCLEALEDYGEGNPEQCESSGCNIYTYDPTWACEDGGETDYGPVQKLTSAKAYCTRKIKGNNTAVPCHYEFVKSKTCTGDCESIPYNRTKGGVGQQIQSPICVSKPGPCEKLGTQKCHTNSDCVVLGEQCVTDICANLGVYNPVTKEDGECTQDGDPNWRIICKEYYIYKSTGRGGDYKIEKELKCGSRFGKYYGNYTTPDPCALLTTKFQWIPTDSGDHGCGTDPKKCDYPHCASEDAPRNCTSASGIDGVKCEIVDGSCTDGREAVYTPPAPEQPEECGRASLFHSPSVLVMFILAVFVTVFHTF